MAKLRGPDRERVEALIAQGFRPSEIVKQLPHIPIANVSGVFHLRKYGKPSFMGGSGAPAHPETASQTALAAATIAAAQSTLSPEQAASPIAAAVREATPVLPAIPTRPANIPGPGGTSVEAPAAPPPPAPLSSITPDRAARALETGFQPVVVNASQAPGHISSWQLKYMIRRLEPPDGVLGEEYAPFGSPQLMQKYGGGLYEIDILKNGVLIDRQQERIAGEPRKVAPHWRSLEESLQELGAGSSQIPRGRPFALSGEETMLKAMDTIEKIEERVTTKQAAAEGSRQTADASVANTAIAALKESFSRPPDTSQALLFEKMLTLENGRSEAERHRYEDERRLMETRHQQELVREQERAKHEIELKKMEMDSQAKQNEAFFLRMQELSNTRDTKMQEIANTRDLLQREFAEKQQKLLEEHLAEERKKLAEMNAAIVANDEEKKAEFKEWKRREVEHFDEVKKLRLAGSDKAVEIENQRMWGDIVKNGIESLSTRVETVMKARMLGEIAPEGGIRLPAGARIPGLGGPAPKPQTPAGGNGNMATMAETIFGTDVFKETILPEIDKHIAARSPTGMFLSWLGGLVLQDGRVNVFVNWLFLRTWPQVLDEARPHIPASSFAIWNDLKAQAWFDRIRKVYYDQLRLQEEAMEAAAASAAPAAPASAPEAPVVPAALVSPAEPPAPSEKPQAFGDR